MWKYSVYTHGISSPKISNAIGLDNVFEVLKKLSIGETSTRCLDDEWYTTKRYFILSTGAINVLFNAPAIPPEMKLLAILNYSFSYFMVILASDRWYYEWEI